MPVVFSEFQYGVVAAVAGRLGLDVPMRDWRHGRMHLATEGRGPVREAVMGEFLAYGVGQDGEVNSYGVILDDILGVLAEDDVE